jgi:hypothetical protein
VASNWSQSNAERWDTGFAALLKFRRREGHCCPSRNHIEGNFNLGQWVSVQRYRKHLLPLERKRRLDPTHNRRPARTCRRPIPARTACVLCRGVCAKVSAQSWISPVVCGREGSRMTASAYIFAVVMTVVIVWIVAEVSGQDAFKL